MLVIILPMIPILEKTFSYSSSSFGTDITFRTGQFFERLEFSLDMAVVSESRDYTLPENLVGQDLALAN